MRATSTLAGCVGVLFAAVLRAADPPYVGRWTVNEDKSDRGVAMTFESTAAGDLRLLEGGRTHILRFDGKDYPHPLGGAERWIRIDERTWETIYSKDGTVLGDAVYQLSADGQTLTRRMKGDTEAAATIHRRRSGEPKGLAGTWSLVSASRSTTTIEVADGYDLVVVMGGAKCQARFDGGDYPIVEPGGKPSAFEACRISKIGDRGFTLTVTLNGKPVAADTFTASPDGGTLTQTSGPAGQPPAYSIVHDRQ